MPRDSGVNTRTTAGSVRSKLAALPIPADALSSPTEADLAGAGLALWPPGAAWGTPDGEAHSAASVIYRFTLALLVPFSDLYGRARRFLEESLIAGIFERLDDWESEYGLPDECLTGNTSQAARIRAIEARVTSNAVTTPADFIDLAASYGFSITIEEPAMFQCGFSECGGEHTLGNPREEVFLIVTVIDPAVDYFRVSESEVGYDPLFDLGDAQPLLCLLRRVAPAWTIPILV